MLTPGIVHPLGKPAITVSPGAHVSLGATQQLRDLKVEGTAGVQPDKAVVIRAERLVIADGATMDMTNGDLTVGASATTRDATLAAVAAAIRSARNAPQGLWTGTGLTSSRARANAYTTLAAVINPGLTHFSGQPVGPHDLLVKYTYNGDANVDGIIDADDYFRIDRGFLERPANPTFAQGNFNYDTLVDADDYFLIDSAFLGQGLPLSSGAAIAAAVEQTALSVTAVPEPGAAAMLMTPMIFLTRRRRRPP
jgi:hypothetical protein